MARLASAMTAIHLPRPRRTPMLVAMPAPPNNTSSIKCYQWDTTPSAQTQSHLSVILLCTRLTPYRSHSLTEMEHVAWARPQSTLHCSARVRFRIVPQPGWREQRGYAKRRLAALKSQSAHSRRKSCSLRRRGILEDEARDTNASPENQVSHGQNRGTAGDGDDLNTERLRQSASERSSAGGRSGPTTST